MPANLQANLPPSLASMSAPLGDRIRFYSAANADLIRNLRCGLVYIMAMWSGPARKAYPAFISAVLQGDPNKTLEVLVVDNDGVVQEWQAFSEIRDIVGGWGEVIAVKNGTIVGTSGSDYAPEKYATIVKSLVYACQPTSAGDASASS